MLCTDIDGINSYTQAILHTHPVYKQGTGNPLQHDIPKDSMKLTWSIRTFQPIASVNKRYTTTKTTTKTVKRVVKQGRQYALRSIVHATSTMIHTIVLTLDPQWYSISQLAMLQINGTSALSRCTKGQLHLIIRVRFPFEFLRPSGVTTPIAPYIYRPQV